VQVAAVPDGLIAFCAKINPCGQCKKEACLVAGVVEGTIKLSKLESRYEGLPCTCIREADAECWSSSQDNCLLDDRGGSVVDYYGGPGTCSEGEVELWVDIAVVKVAVEEAGSDEVARPVPDVHGVAVLPVVCREITHGSEVLLVQVVWDQQLRCLAAGDEGGVRSPLDPDGICVIFSTPAVQADETCRMM
jgi:hypothetical protein